jgi:hypothetical protein
VDSLSIRAEQAMLGAVLSDPAGQQHVLDHVVPADMSRPWHGQVLAAMQRLRERAALPGPSGVYRELQNDPDLPPRISRDGVLLADLMEAAPRTAHAAAYTAMVIEGSIRQRASLAGSRIAQAAESGDIEGALHQGGQARQELEDCHVRWLALPELMRRPSPGSERARRQADHARNSRADVEEAGRLREDSPAGMRLGAAAVPAGDQAETPAAAASRPEWRARQRICGPAHHCGAEESAAEVRALRDLTADQSQLGAVRGWLRPEHFARAGHGELYAVMQDMAVAGKPVDPVTVTWEAARRGVRADPARLAGGTGPFAVASAREVHRHGLLAQAAHIGRAIQLDAADPACSTSQLLEAAVSRLCVLDAAPAPEPGPAREAPISPMPGQSAMTAPARGPGREAAQ